MQVLYTKPKTRVMLLIFWNQTLFPTYNKINITHSYNIWQQYFDSSLFVALDTISQENIQEQTYGSDILSVSCISIHAYISALMTSTNVAQIIDLITFECSAYCCQYSIWSLTSMIYPGWVGITIPENCQVDSHSPNYNQLKTFTRFLPLVHLLSTR